jgi:cytochrome subunit of sulfide dehydrogenase
MNASHRIIALAALAGASVLIAGTIAPASAQNADPQLLTISCSGCHGPGGRSPGPIPSINSRPANQIAEALRGFRDGTRPGTVMGRISKGYTDTEIDAVAREIAANWK